MGGGGWGAIGSVAAPGNHFGYDGGWGYSDNGKVWLSVRCDAVVGRMTELFLEISVTSYYANGGVWNPTWFTDYPDTHVDSFIRDETGWLASKSGFYDTTYDNSNYHGPYVTDTLRVARRSWDWRAWAGVRAWCDSPDSAYGIDTTAEASQIVPAHVLNDDASWRGKIVTVRPRSAEHLFMDASGGGLDVRTNVVGWQDTFTTNQNWIVVESPQGRTSLVPVHTGASALYLDLQEGIGSTATTCIFGRPTEAPPSRCIFMISAMATICSCSSAAGVRSILTAAARITARTSINGILTTIG